MEKGSIIDLLDGGVQLDHQAAEAILSGDGHAGLRRFDVPRESEGLARIGAMA
jgi:hypothetical protein